MKKLICLLLAAVSVASLAACSKAPADETAATTAQIEAATIKNWPDTVVFRNIPAVGGDIIRYQENTNDRGYTYTFEVNDIDYQGIKNYVKQLEAAGFGVYNSSNLNTVKTEDMLPEVLPEGQHNATWVGNRRGFYVAITWYADEYYTVNELPQSYNARLVFYSYNAFENVTK